MRAVYRMLVQTKEYVPCKGSPGVTTFDNVRVTWVLGPEGSLKEAVLEISGLPLTYTPDGAISYHWPELEEQAYRAAAYLASRVRIQTGLDALTPDSVLGKTSDDLQPETEEERREFEERPKGRRQATLQARALMRGNLDPTDYGVGSRRSAAYALFADALRAESPFVKFRLFYEVVECFLPKDNMAGDDIDQCVSGLVSQYDPAYTCDDVRQIRDIRRRCVHPLRRDHLNPEDLPSSRTVAAKLEEVRKLAELLLRHCK